MTCAFYINAAATYVAGAALAAQKAGRPWPKMPPYTFPRSREKRIARMTRYLEWRREQIAARRWRQMWLFMFWTCAPPLALVIIGLCWKLLLWVGLA